MRKEHLHASIDRKIFEELLNVWRIEQQKALEKGKSAVTELLLKMGIKEYYLARRHLHSV